MVRVKLEVGVKAVAGKKRKSAKTGHDFKTSKASSSSSSSVKPTTSSLSQHHPGSVQQHPSPLSNYGGYLNIKITPPLDSSVNLNPVVILEKLEDIYLIDPNTNNLIINQHLESETKKRRITSPLRIESHSTLLKKNMPKLIKKKRPTKYIGKNLHKSLNDQPGTETVQSQRDDSCCESDMRKVSPKVIDQSQNEESDDEIVIPKISGFCSLASTGDTPNERMYKINLTREEAKYFIANSKYELVRETAATECGTAVSFEDDCNEEDIKPVITSCIDISDIDESDGEEEEEKPSMAPSNDASEIDQSSNDNNADENGSEEKDVKELISASIYVSDTDECCNDKNNAEDGHVKPSMPSYIDVQDPNVAEKKDHDDYDNKSLPDYIDTTEMLSHFELDDENPALKEEKSLAVLRSPAVGTGSKPISPIPNKSSTVMSSACTSAPLTDDYIESDNTSGTETESLNILKEPVEIQEEILKIPHKVIKTLPASLSISCKSRKKTKQSRTEIAVKKNQGLTIVSQTIGNPNAAVDVPTSRNVLEHVAVPPLEEEAPKELIKQCKTSLDAVSQPIDNKTDGLKLETVISSNSTEVNKKLTSVALGDEELKVVFSQLDDDCIIVPKTSPNEKTSDQLDKVSPRAFRTLLKTSQKPNNASPENVIKTEDSAENDESTKLVDKTADLSCLVSASRDVTLENEIQGGITHNTMSSSSLKESSPPVVLPSPSAVEKPVSANVCVQPQQGPSQSTKGGGALNQLIPMTSNMNIIQILKAVTPSGQESSSEPPIKKMKLEGPNPKLLHPIVVHHKGIHIDSTSAVKTPLTTTNKTLLTVSEMPHLVPFLQKQHQPSTAEFSVSTSPKSYLKQIKIPTTKIDHTTISSKSILRVGKVPHMTLSKGPITFKKPIQGIMTSAVKVNPMMSSPLKASKASSSVVKLPPDVMARFSIPAMTTSTPPPQRKETISLSKVSQLPKQLKHFKTGPKVAESKTQQSIPTVNKVPKSITLLKESRLQSLKEVTESIPKAVRMPEKSSPLEKTMPIIVTVPWQSSSSPQEKRVPGVAPPPLLPGSKTASQMATADVSFTETTRSKSPPQESSEPSTSRAGTPTAVATTTSQQTMLQQSNEVELEIIREVTPPHTSSRSPSTFRDSAMASPTSDPLADGLVRYSRRLLLALLLGERAGARDFTLELHREAGRLDQLRVSYPSSQLPSVNILVRCGPKLVTYSSLFYGADATDPMQDCELFHHYQQMETLESDVFMVLTNRYVGQSLSPVFGEWPGTIGGLRVPLYRLKKDFQGQDNVLARLCGPLDSENKRTSAETFLNQICFAVGQTESVLERYLQRKLDSEFIKPEQAKQVLAKLYEWSSQYIGENKSGDISISSSDFSDVIRKMKKQLNVNYQLQPPKSYFFGRDFELLKADQILKVQSKEIIDLVVCGSAGVGKTEFVRHFLQQHEHMYSSVLVINAESRESLQISLQKAAKHFKLDTNTTAPINIQACRDIAGKLFDHFSNKKALILFDNVDTDECIQNLLFILQKNITSATAVIFTSRLTTWDDVPVIKLDVFEKEEAKLFLHQNLSSDESDDELVEHLAQQLSYHPFALQIAVTCINREVAALKVIDGKLALQKIIKGYLIQNKKLQENFNISSLEDKQSEAFLASLITAWQRTKKSIKNEKYGEIALKIFEIMSYMASEEIDLKVFLLLSDIIELEGKDRGDSDEEEEGALEGAQRVLGTAVSILSSYCLLEAYDGKARVHRLLQQVVRTNLRDCEHREYAILDAALSIAQEDNKQNERSYDLSATNFSKPLLFYWIDIMNHSVNYKDIIIKYSILLPKLMMDLFNSNACKEKINYTCALFQTIIGLLNGALNKSNSNYSKILSVIINAKLQLARFLWLDKNDTESEQVFLQVHASLLKSMGDNKQIHWHAEAFKAAYQLERLRNDSQESDVKSSKSNIVYSLANIIKNFDSILNNHFGSLIVLESIAFELSSMPEWQIFSIKIYTELLAKRAALREDNYVTPSPVVNILKLLPSLNHCLWNKVQQPEVLRLLRLCLDEALLCREVHIRALTAYLMYVSDLEDKTIIEEQFSEELLDRLVNRNTTFSFIFNLGMCFNQAGAYNLEVRVFEKVINSKKFGEKEREVLKQMLALATSLIRKEHFECTTQEFDQLLVYIKWEYLEWMGKTMKKMGRYDLVCRIIDKLWNKPQHNLSFWHSQLVTELKRFGDQLLTSGKKEEALGVYQETFIKLAKVDKEIGSEKYTYPALKGMSPEKIKSVLENEFFIL